jgi:cytochrome c556
MWGTSSMYMRNPQLDALEGVVAQSVGKNPDISENKGKIMKNIKSRGSTMGSLLGAGLPFTKYSRALYKGKFTSPSLEMGEIVEAPYKGKSVASAESDAQEESPKTAKQKWVGARATGDKAAQEEAYNEVISQKQRFEKLRIKFKKALERVPEKYHEDVKKPFDELASEFEKNPSERLLKDVSNYVGLVPQVVTFIKKSKGGKR